MMHCMRVRWIVFASASFLSALSPLAVGQAPPLVPPATSEPSKAETAPAPVANRRAENAELLRVAQRRLDQGDPTDGIAAQSVALLQSLDSVLAQQEALDQQLSDLEARRKELDAQPQATTTGTNEKQTFCTFVEFDALKDELAAEEARAKLVDDKLAASKAALEKAQRAFDENESQRRQAQEAADKGKDGPNSAELFAAAEQAKLTSQLANESVTLRKREVARDALGQEVQRLAVKRFAERLARLSPMVIFAEADFQEQIAAIKKKEESANKSLHRAQASLQNAELQLRQAQQEFDALAGDGVETSDRAVAAEKLEAARRSREKLVDEIDSLTQRLQRLAQLRVAWNRRFAAAAYPASPNEQAFDELKSWQKETRTILDELDSDLRMQILRMRDLRATLTSLTKKIDAAKDGPKGLLSWLDIQRVSIEAMLRIHETNLVTIETSRRVHEKLLEEIGRGVKLLNPKNLALGAWHQVKVIWGQELTSLGNSSITVGKVVLCVSVLLGGWFFARVFSVLLANRILKRFRLSKDATAAVRTLVFYSLLAASTLAALKTVNVPLTAFTIFGGALAIGVGFGSQALVNNFIGGLIMLAERPVRLGERITFGNYDGVVEDVGFRCTRLRTANDHLVTIPNSTLINESIENIARRRTIRRTLNVAISIDTPRFKIAEVVAALRDVLEEKEIRERIHPIIGFEEFPPRVHFNDLNAQHLNIQIVYWYAPTDWWGYMAHSERVNFRIMEELERLRIDLGSTSRTMLTVNDRNHDAAARVA